MNFIWTDGPKVYRCMLDKPVTIKAFDFGSTSAHSARITDMGYIMFDGQFLANVYGSINPEIPGKYFDNIDEAKAYVEEHALAGIAINKLTR